MQKKKVADAVRQSDAVTDFQKAAATAEAAAGQSWWMLQGSQRVAAIYKQLRALDAERAKANGIQPRQRDPALIDIWRGRQSAR
jgi:hypothetical protein